MILVTGGAGFIGSHTCVELIKNGYQPIVVDDFSNSSSSVIDRINQITGKEVICVKMDVKDIERLSNVFNQYPIEAVIHFAGYKAVGESVDKPLKYYQNNVAGAMDLCRVMADHGVKRLLFSSSATVYHRDDSMPLRENDRLGSTNPYGWTKLIVEKILQDISASDKQWSIVSLRYFNPIGAHSSGLIGDCQATEPNNLIPYIAGVAAGTLKELRVFGNDYPTLDGTGVRDYIHVVDLAKGHVGALDFVFDHKGIEPFNLGTGRGYSVLEVIQAFVRSTGISIPYRIAQRRSGDIAESYACVDKAKDMLGWQATLGIEQMCMDAWNFESNRA